MYYTDKLLFLNGLAKPWQKGVENRTALFRLLNTGIRKEFTGIRKSWPKKLPPGIKNDALDYAEVRMPYLANLSRKVESFIPRLAAARL